jgi:hypothetical protein
MPSSVNEDFVAQIVKGEEGFQWLDESNGWFWLSSVPRNRLLNLIEKILSVAEHIEVAELRAGVARVHRMNGFAPPRRVLLELCRQASGYRIEGNTVIADPALNWEEVLAATERLMVQVLRKNNSVMQNAEFERICLEMGINRSTFWAYLTYSPIIARYAPGVSGLPGAEVSPGFVESLISRQRKPGRVLKDYGWTADGGIWLGYRLSQAMLTSGVFTVPSSMKPFVKGQFILKDNDNSRIGSVVVKENGAWGLGPFFKRRGGEPGDSLVILFNLAAHEAAVRIGDASLFYDFQPVDGEPVSVAANVADDIGLEGD